MKKRILFFAAVLALSLLSAPAFATDSQGEQSKNAGGKHNFDQWQTIKRLQINH